MNMDLACGLVLQCHRHADIPIGNDAYHLALVIHNGHGAAVTIPHQQRGGFQRGIRAAGRNLVIHDFFDNHCAPPLTERVDTAFDTGTCTMDDDEIHWTQQFISVVPAPLIASECVSLALTLPRTPHDSRRYAKGTPVLPFVKGFGLA
jgi:hypothetical protein